MGGAPDGGRLSGRPLPKKIIMKDIQLYALLFWGVIHLITTIGVKDENLYQHRITRAWIFTAAAILASV